MATTHEVPALPEASPVAAPQPSIAESPPAAPDATPPTRWAWATPPVAAPQPQAPLATPQMLHSVQQASAMAATALTCGVFGVLLALTVLFGEVSVILGVVALLFAFLARNTLRDVKAQGFAVKSRMATAGLVLGFIDIALGIAAIAALLSLSETL